MNILLENQKSAKITEVLISWINKDNIIYNVTRTTSYFGLTLRM